MQTAIPSSVSTNPLELYLRRLIDRHGPITIAEYMALCLGHPDYGYYQTRDPFGRGGDFTTAPEISQMFGELIGAWAIAQWQAMGGGAFNLVEFGPGRGTLMRDLLRIADKIAPDFVAAATLHLVETSPVLQDAQAKLLANYSPQFHAGIEDVPEGRCIYIMNEFLDALPVRQFVVTDTGLCERRVGVVDGKFAFVVEREARVPNLPLPVGEVDRRSGEGLSVPAVSPSSASLRYATSPTGRGDIIETCPAALAIVREMSARIASQGGAALIVDYGYDAPGGVDTFQAVKDHAYANVLETPGEADLTAHVAFAALAQAAQQMGVAVAGPMGQGEFLIGLGIAQRARKLIAAGDVNAEAALHRLTADDQMGRLFKVMIFEKN